MSLILLNTVAVDLTKISYIGEIDSEIKPHLGTIIHFFTIVVDGYPIKIKDEKKPLTKLREKLVDDLTRVDFNLPG